MIPSFEVGSPFTAKSPSVNLSNLETNTETTALISLLESLIPSSKA